MEALDWVFHFIHNLVIVINTTAWMSRRTLPLAQATLALTLLSWIGFGAVYGFGYCFLTDWHWQVKEATGETHLPNSYIKYILDRATGQDISPFQIDVLTAIVTAISILGCSIQTYRQRNSPRPKIALAGDDQKDR